MTIQQQIFQAIDTITQKKIDDLEFDRLVEGIITTDKDEKDGSYGFNFNGMEYRAFPTSSMVKYNIGEVVYVLAIGGDFSKKKVIISSKAGNGDSYVDISKELENINLYGRNYITTPTTGDNIIIFNGGNHELELETLPTFAEDGVAQTNLRLYAEVWTDLKGIELPVDYDFGFELKIKYKTFDENQNEVFYYKIHNMTSREMLGNRLALNFGKQYEIDDLDLEGIAVGLEYCKLYSKNIPVGEVPRIKFRNVRLEYVQEIIADAIQSQNYKLEVYSSNGTVFKNGAVDTILEPVIYRGQYDITGQFLGSQIEWYKSGEDTPLKIDNPLKFQITSDMVNGRQTFLCYAVVDGERLAGAQITLVDLHDTSTLQAFVDTSMPKLQLLKSNGDYSPSWYSADNSQGQKVTASLFGSTSGADDLLSGTTEEIKSRGISTKWFVNNGAGFKEITIGMQNDGYYLNDYGGQASFVRITRNVMTSDLPALSIKCVIKIVNIETKEQQEIVLDADFGLSIQGLDGDSGTGFTIVLSNETHQVITNINGIPIKGELGTGGRAFTDVTVLSLGQPYTPIASSETLTNGTFSLSIAKEEGLHASINLGRVIIDDMINDTGYVDIRVCIYGLCGDRTSCECLTKRMNLSKSVQGAIWLELDTLNIVEGENGFTPTTIKGYAKEKSFTEEKDYFGRFQILSSKDGINYSEVIFETTDGNKDFICDFLELGLINKLELSKTLKVRLLAPGGKGVVVDSQTIAILSDGVSATYGYLWGPSGTVFKNLLEDGAITELPIQMKVYSGASDRTNIASYRWYQQDNIGGWIEIPNNNHTLIIGADMVSSKEVFKCIATYKEQDIESTIVITDQTDPYQVLIQATDTVFKNNTGKGELNCVVLQNGIDIDQSGEKLIYHWVKYKGSTKVSFQPTIADDVVNSKVHQILGITFTSPDINTIILSKESADVKKGEYYLLEGQGRTAREVIDIVGTRVTVTPPVTPSGTASGVYYGNFKNIVINASEINDTNTFYCDIYVP